MDGAKGILDADDRLSLIAELVSGTDQIRNVAGRKVATNRLAAFAEANYQWSRGVNVRARVDRMETNRASDLAYAMARFADVEDPVLFEGRRR